MSGFLHHLRWACWGLCGCLTLVLLSQPVSVEAQATLAVTAILCLVGLSFLPRWPWAQQLFLAIGTTVLLRYLYWRLTSTLPPVTDVVGFALGGVLLAAELFCAFILAVSLLINVDPLRRKTLERGEDAELPTVDVFIPSYNEDQSILAMTICAAKGMDYPAEKLRVWLLDDGGTDQKCADKDPARANEARSRRVKLQALCRELGATYLTRARNEHAKAGNLNNGLAHSCGEIAVVFDADHAPFRGFLRETVGYFRLDPKLFLVQTPHVFLNPDPIERNLQTFERMPSENEMFYGVTQRGLDKWNGSFFCGSAALLRRAALATSGGFSGITITEDCETALELHAQGWTSIYVDKPLIAGLQPETFSSFIGQRSRWCQGMFQIFLLKNPFLRLGLKPIQRIAYLSSMAFWFFPFPRLVFMITPLLHIFFDVKLFVSSVDETLAYTLAYMCVNMLMQSYVYGQVRWPWVSELYEFVQGVFLIKALGAVALSPRKPTFNVTTKGVSLEHDHISELATPFVVCFLALLAGVVVAAWRYAYEPGIAGSMLVVGIWTSFNLLLAGVGLGVIAERRHTDPDPRLAINRKGVLNLAGEAFPVQITYVSASRCGIADDAAFDGVSIKPDEEIRGWLSVVPADGGAPLDPIAVRWRKMSKVGVGQTVTLSFDDPETLQYRSIAELMYGDTEAMSRFLQKRRKPIGLLRGSLQFAFWGFTEPFRALVIACRKRPLPQTSTAQAQAAVPAPLTAPTPAQSPRPSAHWSAHVDEVSWLAAIMALSGASGSSRYVGARPEDPTFIPGTL